MENLNAEQIIMALECLGGEQKKCAECVYNGIYYPKCREHIANDTLSLIKELTEHNAQILQFGEEYETLARKFEAENKKLTEENESIKQCLEHEHASFMETFGEYADACDMLTAENERLRAEVSVKKKLLDKCVDLEDKVKADTVRQMQKLIKERCIKGGIYPVLVARTIEQVAKEILEGV